MASVVVGLVGCSDRKVGEKSPVRVKVQTVQVQPIRGVQVFSGTVEEAAGSTLGFPVGGTLTEIRVSAGQRVRQGELLASVNDATLQNSHAATVAALEQAEDAYARMKQLHDNNSLPEMQWAEVQSKLKQARSAEQISRKSLEDARLYAPFSGVIAGKYVEVGQNVMPGAPVVRLVRVEQVKVGISVPESEIARMQLGQRTCIRVPALGGKTFEGSVVEKGIAAHPLSADHHSADLLPHGVRRLRAGRNEEERVSRFYHPAGYRSGCLSRIYRSGSGGTSDETAGRLHFQLQGGEEGKDTLRQQGRHGHRAGAAERRPEQQRRVLEQVQARHQ